MFDPDNTNNDINEPQAKINMFSVIVFFILTVPMVLFAGFKYLDSSIGLFANSHKEIGLQKILGSEKGSNDHQRKEKLQKICDEFLSITGRYGFTPNDVINELKQH